MSAPCTVRSVVVPSPNVEMHGRRQPVDGLLFPETPAILWRSEQGCELVDFSTSAKFTLTGAVAGAAVDFLNSRQRSVLLEALGNTALMEVLHRLGPSVPVSPQALLKLTAFDTLFIELLNTCNERCLHCYANAAPESRESLEWSTCQNVLEDAAELKMQRVQFTGGDPLLWRYLPEAVHYANDLGLPMCEIYTNGLALSSQLLAKLAPLNPKFAFSFYSHDASTHDAITQTPGSWERTIQALKSVIAAKLDVRAAMVVMDANKNHIDATQKYLQNLGIDTIGVSISRPVGRGAEPSSVVHFPDEDHTHRPVTGPLSPRGSLRVGANGDVSPCIFNRSDVLGNVQQQRLTQIVAQPQRLLLSKLPIRGDPADLYSECTRTLQCRSCQATAYGLRALWSTKN